MSSCPLFSPSSDKRFWSTLRSRIDTILENRKPFDPTFPTQMNSGEPDRAKRMREDSLLLLRGFDSVSCSVSQLSKNLDNALQGARDLARPPTITDIYHSAMEKAKSREEEAEEAREAEEESEEGKRVLKRKFDAQQGHDLRKAQRKRRISRRPKINSKSFRLRHHPREQVFRLRHFPAHPCAAEVEIKSVVGAILAFHKKDFPSVWVMMNKETQRLSKIPDEIRAEIGLYFLDSPPVLDKNNW